jgi:Fic family protein
MNQFIEQERQAPSDKRTIKFPRINSMTSDLSIELLCNMHKLLLYNSNTIGIGELREHKVWVGGPNADFKSATFIPPEPSKVKELTDNLLKEWRDSYKTLLKAKKEVIIESITKFHSKFLDIHPFLDGNGRIARFLLNQQVSELLDIDRLVIIEDRLAYFSALSEAHEGKYEKLKLILKQAIYGQE